MTTALPRTWIIYLAAGLGLLAVGVAAGVFIARAPQTAAAVDDDVLYWYDPMYPDQHFDAPGKSPFMDMQLVPRRRGETDAASSVRIAPGVTQNLGVRTAVVERGDLAPVTIASGVIAFNDRDVANVEAKAGGFVLRTYRRAPGDVVAAGDPLIDLRAPDWTAALADYLALRSDPKLAGAARQRLDLLGVPAGSIAAAETSGAAPAAFTIRAPIEGAITKLDAREGMTLSSGAAIASINGLSPVWLIASVPQGGASGLTPGLATTARLAAFPNETFNGKVDALLPAASATSRAVEVRIALPNPGGRLRPGMTAEVTFSAAQTRTSLLVPSEAVIRTGRRTLVITLGDDGSFVPVAVETGATAMGRTEIRTGLSEGQKVVASGQFLIDSEASLAGVLARLGSGPAAGGQTVHTSHGRITAIDASGVTFAHEPVASLNWPAMTMTFAWGPQGPTAGLKVGDEADFAFRQDGAAYVIASITPTGGRP